MGKDGKGNVCVGEERKEWVSTGVGGMTSVWGRRRMKEIKKRARNMS